jgi:hypothetical protein
MPKISSAFWPDDLKTDVKTPLEVLRPRADELVQVTSGALVGEVTTTEDNENETAWENHHLDVVAPVLNGLRNRILTVSHEKSAVYPAFVRGRAFGDNVREVMSDEHLVLVLRDALKHDRVKATLLSMIAMSNEKMRR